MKSLFLYLITALAELAGCYLPYLWLRQGRSIWLLLPAAASLVLFSWLLTLHDAASGRVYAAYGCVYVAVAIFWLWKIEGITPTVWDITGSCIAILGMAVILLQPIRIQH